MYGTAVSRTEGRQSRGPGKTHREVYLPQLGSPAICVCVCGYVAVCGCVAVWLCGCVCGCVTNAALMQQGANAD